MAQHHPEPWLPAVLGRLGVDFTEGHSGVPARALNALHASLAQGRAVLCTVDRTSLPWQAEAFALSMDPYPVVVTGAHDGVFYVDDQDALPHVLSEEDFARAWSAHKKGRHHHMTVEQPGKPVDLPAAILPALDTTVMSKGRAGDDEIRALSAEIASLDAPGPDRALLTELADLVDAARTIEQRATTLLTT